MVDMRQPVVVITLFWDNTVDKKKSFNLWNPQMPKISHMFNKDYEIN